MESLKEMIEESGIKVPTAESWVGKVELLIRNRIEFLTPCMIVIGRDSFRKQALNNLVDHATCPVLFVPQNANASLPSSFALRPSNDLILPKTSYPLLKIIQQTTRRLTILTGSRSNTSEVNIFQDQLTDPNFNLSVTYLQAECPTDANAMRTFITSNAFDLLCVVRDKRTILQRLFTKDPAEQLVHAVEIPVLVVK
jgi:nucleotide-binding universal stress UspA family protein